MFLKTVSGAGPQLFLFLSFCGYLASQFGDFALFERDHTPSVCCLPNKQTDAGDEITSSRKPFVALIIILLLGHLGLGRSTALSAALFLFNDRHSSRDKLNTPVAAVGAGMQLAVVVEVILTVELVLSAELAREAVGAFTMVAVEFVSWL